MAGVGAPKGNQFGAKDKRWARAIAAALDRRSKREGVEQLEALAEVLIDKCAEGESWALKELGDRLDGKSVQATELSGPNGGPVSVLGRLVLVEAKDAQPDSGT